MTFQLTFAIACAVILGLAAWAFVPSWNGAADESARHGLVML